MYMHVHCVCAYTCLFITICKLTHARINCLLLSIHLGDDTKWYIKAPTHRFVRSVVYMHVSLTYPGREVSVKDTSGVEVGHALCNVQRYLHPWRPGEVDGTVVEQVF